MTPDDAAECAFCRHRSIEHDALGRRPCRKWACPCRRLVLVRNDATPTPPTKEKTT